MENCLVTTLKSGISTDKVLPRINALTMVFDSSAFDPKSSYISSDGFGFRSNREDAIIGSDSLSQIKCLISSVSSTENLPYEAQKSDSISLGIVEAVEDGDLFIQAEDFYNDVFHLNISALSNVRFINVDTLKYMRISRFIASGDVFAEPFDVSLMNNWPLAELTINGNLLYGKIELSDVTALEKINCSQNRDERSIECNIMQFVNAVKLEYLGFEGSNNSKVTGDINAMLDAMAIARNGVSGALDHIRIRLNGTSCTTTHSKKNFQADFANGSWTILS